MNITRGVRNNNPGNIDRGKPPTEWVGLATDAEMTPEQKAEKRFAVFSSPEYGIRALAKLLQTYHEKYGLRTVRDIINRWAPPNENDTGAYVGAVAKAIGVSPDARVDVHYMAIAKPMVEAIIAHENSGYRYSPEVVDMALSLAGVSGPAAPDAPPSLDTVAEQQAALLALGYYHGVVDGISGRKTLAAIKAFQADAGLSADGKVGPKTRSALLQRVIGG